MKQLATIVMGLWLVLWTPGPCETKSYTWKGASGATRMTNIATLVPKAILDREPEPDCDVRIPGTAYGKSAARALPAAGATRRLKAQVQRMDERNRNIIQMKNWFFKLLEDPGRLNDPDFADWIRRLMAQSSENPPMTDLRTRKAAP